MAHPFNDIGFWLFSSFQAPIITKRSIFPLVISAKEIVFSPAFVCLSISLFVCILMKFLDNVGF